MIPDVIRRMHAAKLSGAAGIDIWNSGEARREFMYVGDLADAIYRHIDSEDAPDVMNIGLGHDHSILDYSRAIQKIVRSEEHTSELQSLMRISYAVFCLKKKKTKIIY